MNDYIPLSMLNDFIFCPYSIYLHSVYMESDEDLYKATPQIKGTIAHHSVDEKKSSTRRSDVMSLPVYCDELGISGKIDVYKQDKHLLIERKNNFMDNLVAKIEAYSKHFTFDDSVIIFDVNSDKLTKYGNAIHRDQPAVYF